MKFLKLSGYHTINPDSLNSSTRSCLQAGLAKWGQPNRAQRIGRSVHQAINGGYPRLQIEWSRCRTPRGVDLAALAYPPTTCVQDLAGRLRCEKCKKAGKRLVATLLQLAPKARGAV